jgi:hypothetical protein
MSKEMAAKALMTDTPAMMTLLMMQEVIVMYSRSQLRRLHLWPYTSNHQTKDCAAQF